MDKQEEKMNKEYTVDEILRAISKLPEENKNILLANFSIPQIHKLLNSQEELHEWCYRAIEIMNTYSALSSCLFGIKDIIDNQPTDEAKRISEEYNGLSVSEKERIALELLNNAEFKTHCMDIMEKDFARLMKADEVMSVLDKTFKISKLYGKIMDMNRKNDHKYEVV